MLDRSRSQLLVSGIAVVALLAAAAFLLRPRGPERAAAPVRIDGPSGAPEGRGRSHPRTSELYVHIAGAVRRPGLHRVPRGSRVAAALERAGGPTRRAELSAVNLAARVADGQQIVVPRAGAVGPAAPAGSPSPSGASASPGAKLSLGAATVEQLDGVDGIGPTLAKRIVEYRDAHGGFRSVDQLREVDGIGEKRFESLRQAVAP